MSNLDEFENERIPVRYCLEEAMSLPEYRDAMYIEQMLSRYYYKKGDVRLGTHVSEVIRRHLTSPDRFQRAILSDEEAREVLTELIKSGMIGGQYHFVAVYRILRDYCNFPKDFTSFAHRIIKLGLELNGKRLEYDSLYQSVQKGIGAHSALGTPYKNWTEYTPHKGENYTTFLRQKKVADKLLEILRDRKILLKE